MNDDEISETNRENPSDRIADHKQNELENKDRKTSQIQGQSSASKEFPKPFPIKESSEPIFAEDIQVGDYSNSSKPTAKKAPKQENKRLKSGTTNEKVNDKDASHTSHDLAFVYDLSGYILAFLKMTDDYIMQCPKCQIETKYIIKHIGAKEKCKDKIDLQVFKHQFKM